MSRHFSRTLRVRPSMLLVSILAMCGLSAAALAMDVHGSLNLSQLKPEATAEKTRARSFYWEEWNGFIDPKPPSIDPAKEIAAVLVGSIPPLPSAQATKVELWGGDLSPSTIVVRTGTTLTITNHDDLDHVLYASSLKTFGPTPTAPGNTRSVTLGQIGKWSIADKLFSHVHGAVHVIPDLVARGTVDVDGRFTFRDVPAGNYTLKIYRGSKELSSSNIVVPEESKKEKELTLDPVTLAETSANP